MKPNKILDFILFYFIFFIFIYITYFVYVFWPASRASRFRGNPKSLGLHPVPRSPRDDLTGSHMKLAGAVGHRGAVVVDVPDETSAAVAVDLGPLPLYPPVVQGLEERSDFVLFLELELGVVDGRERERAFVSGLEVEVRRE